MKKLILFIAVLTLVALPLAGMAAQVTVKAVDPSNTNEITDPDGSNAKETINNLAVFEKYVTIEEFKPSNSGQFDFKMTWQITNKTGQTWADYHFKIVDAPVFSYNGTDYNITVNFDEPASSADFKGKIPDPASGTELTFYYDPPGGKLIPDGDKLNVQFNILMTGFPDIPPNDKIDYTFTLSQQPSLVPLPGALLLLGGGLTRLLVRRRK